MDFGRVRIDSIERAREFFRAMGCSSFHMGREYPERYEEYLALEVPKDRERDWTQESLSELFDDLRTPAVERERLWSLHAHMEELVRRLETEDALRMIHEATAHIVELLPNRSKVLVAETIVGRSSVERRDGLIFRAHALDRVDIAESLSEIALGLARSARDGGVDPGRCERAISRCDAIRESLGLS